MMYRCRGEALGIGHWLLVIGLVTNDKGIAQYRDEPPSSLTHLPGGEGSYKPIYPSVRQRPNDK